MKKTFLIPNQDNWDEIVMEILLLAPKAVAECNRDRYEKDIEIRLWHALTINPFSDNPQPICTNYHFVFNKLKTAIMAVYDIGASLQTIQLTPKL
jgi:hypothetical protein